MGLAAFNQMRRLEAEEQAKMEEEMSKAIAIKPLKEEETKEELKEEPIAEEVSEELTIDIPAKKTTKTTAKK